MNNSFGNCIDSSFDIVLETVVIQRLLGGVMFNKGLGG